MLQFKGVITMFNLHENLTEMILQKVKKDEENTVWETGKFKSVKRLSNDALGELGEDFIAKILKELGGSVDISAFTDRTKKHWDILLNAEVAIEVKTATVGSNGKTFQHEAIEKDRNFNLLVLLDIAPDSVYITVAPKDTIPFDKPNNTWTINEKKMHRRSHGIQYK